MTKWSKNLLKEFEMFDERKHDHVLDSLRYAIPVMKSIQKKRTIISWVIWVNFAVIAITLWYVYG